MGDLIQKLPTDSVPLQPEEKHNFNMLFPQEEQQQNLNVVLPLQKHGVATTTTSTHKKLKKEVTSLFLFILVFFLLNVPYVKQLLVEYIPLCNKSWIITNLLQAILFAFILWIIINSDYSRV